MKKFITTVLACLTAIMPFAACKNNDKLTVVELNEVTHSVFYAPLYVAIENEYFEDEGLKINLTNGGGADNSMTAILSKTAHIGLMGPETVIYVNSQNKKDSPVVFGQLTQKDGSFLVSRNDEPDFKWQDLKGKEILAGRRGGVPAMTFEYVMQENGLKNNVDYTLNYDVQFNLMTSAFIGGTADYCTVFEPTASEYEKEGKWHVVASVGKESGEIPYTSFICLSSYLKENEQTVKSFLRAMKKAFDYMNSHTSKEIAETIVKQFPSTTITSLETSVDNYRSIDAWKTNMQPTEASFERLQDIMEYSGELPRRIAFKSLTDTKLAKEVFG